MSHSTKRFYGVLAAAVVMLAIVTAVVFFVRMRRDDSSDVYVSAGVAVTGSPEAVIRDILAHRPGDASLKTVTIDYPLGGSVFPPEMVSPTFLWHDGDNGTKTWLVDVAFESGGRRIYVLCDGKRDEEPEIDFNCVTETNVFRESEYQAAAKGWTPSERIWSMVKRHSVVGAEITIYGLDERRRIRSRGRVSISTSKDPVGALIFYRDVPLMPSSTKDGVIKPLKKSMWPLIKWRLRDISKPEAPVVMAHLPTCANCHTISRDGRTIAMDIDGPAGDKGAYAVKDISKRMVIEQKDVFTWNNFADKPRGTSTSGLFARISPDGRHVATMLNEKLFVANYTDYRFLQTFYPTRGIVVIYTRSTGEMKRLPGADDPQYVQGNPCWSPDGKTIVFIRARARDPYQAGPRPKQANDPRETPIRYDLYRIPFNDGKGGVAEPIPGASDNGMSNSYPRYSPDGKWIVFVQCRNGMLMRPDSKLYIVPVEGGRARLMTCNTQRMNSYHSFSPNGRWMVFSSKCNTPYTQMFLTHVDERGNDSPAVLIPNSTAANRAVNLPEFAAIAPGALVDITTPAVDYRRHLEKAKKLKDSGRLTEALAELRESLELKTDYLYTYATFGDVLVRQGNADEALGYYRKALQLNPRYFHTYNNLGAALNRLGKYSEAARHFRTALEINPKYAQTHNNLAVALSHLGEPDEADRHFRKAVEIQPDFDRAHRDWGIALGRRGKPREAIERFRKAVEINPKSYGAHRDWGVALVALGEVSEAMGHYRQAVEINPEYSPAYSSMAWILATSADAKVHDGSEAVRLAKIACEKTDYGNVAFLDVLAAAYAEAGRFDDAVRTVGKALALARAEGNAAVIAELQNHLKVFRQKKPLRYIR